MPIGGVDHKNRAFALISATGSGPKEKVTGGLNQAGGGIGTVILAGERIK
jgi:hypothetical protein